MLREQRRKERSVVEGSDFPLWVYVCKTYTTAGDVARQSGRTAVLAE